MNKTVFSAIVLSGISATALHAQSTDTQNAFVTDVPYPDEFATTEYSTTDGEQLYSTLCAGCHMPDGSGAVGAGAYPALKNNQLLEYANYPVSVIVNGQAAMPSLGHLLSDEQVVAVTSYIQSGLGNGYTPDATVQMVADTRPAEAASQMGEHQVEMADDTADLPGDKRDDAAAPQESDDAATSQATDEATNEATEGSNSDGGVIRHALPDSDFPILQAVEVPSNATMVYLSGTVPQIVDDSAGENDQARFGDTKAQTVSTFESIAAKLAALDLNMSNVISMQVFLVAPEGSDAMDFSGFMEGYTQFFGTEDQPNLPTRSVFEVAGLANPNWAVEIEVVAVRE
jgi:enamine deaminase RidA (YjgF/YER057c/UK114 family)/mono/diheme cytochrome c family protein